MADNILISSGQTVGTDDVSGVHYPYIKLAVGAADVSDKVVVPADALAAGLLPAGAMAFNETNWDRWRGNGAANTDLASAARTASTAGPTRTNYNCLGLHVYISVTAAGTGTLALWIQNGIGVTFVTFPTTTVTAGYLFYPGLLAADNFCVARSSVLPRTFNLYVNKSDASSWTFSVVSYLIL